MPTALDILAHKGDGAVAISPHANLHDAARAMHDLGIGSLVVGSVSDPLGIVSERDLVRRLAVDRNAGDATVAEVMGPVVEIDGESESACCMQVMTDRRLRHLMVRSEGVYVGVVSIGDLVKAQLMAQHEAIVELDSYLHSRPSVET